MSSIFLKRFGDELASLIGKKISVETSEGKSYQGNLLGVDEKLDLILGEVTGAGEGVFKIILNGQFIKEVKLMEKPFDLKALSDRLNRIFPGLVRLREDIGAILVMDKIKVTDQGVTEGSGLAAERARQVYEEFLRESSKHVSQ
jgi:small nuclear ribonucleoprotein (snRNP)-like protein